MKAASLLLGTFVLALAGCGSLFGPPPPAPHYWVLDGSSGSGSSAPRSMGTAPSPAVPVVAASTAASAPVIVVALPRAAAGYDTDRIVYTREAHRLEPYAENQWIDTTPRMLQPLLGQALSGTGAFSAVLDTPSPAEGGWKLETSIVRLQHDVLGGRVVFTLRATLVDQPHRTVVAAREFEAAAPTSSVDPAGAVAAANAAVADVLAQLSRWCVAAVQAPRPAGS